MYESFYGLREKPFNLTPDPRFLYLSEMHKEAFAHLVFGIRNRVGFIVVTGEIGTGKTTICRSLLGQLDQDVELAFIFNPCLSPEELLRKINEDFGIRSRAISVKGLIDELNTYLLDRHSKNKNCVLVIDEAQNLAPPVLEQIRLLSNLETERQKLLQIVLIGQPELAEHLELPELRQLNQRITARYHLKPLGEKETLQYIAYRLRVAGGRKQVRFTRSAIKSVYRHSGGTPRVINAICDRALLMGYAKESREVTRRLVKQAAREIRGERVRSGIKKSFLARYVPTPRLAAAAALIVLIGVFIISPVTDRLDVLVALLDRPPAPPAAEVVPPAAVPEEVPEAETADVAELEPDPQDTQEDPDVPETSEPVVDPPAEAPGPEPEPIEVAEAVEEESPELPDEPEAAAPPAEEAPVAEPVFDPAALLAAVREAATELAHTPEQPHRAEEPEVPETVAPVADEVQPPTPVPAPETRRELHVAEHEAPPRKPGVFDAIALVAALMPEDRPERVARVESEPAPVRETVAETVVEPVVEDEDTVSVEPEPAPEPEPDLEPEPDSDPDSDPDTGGFTEVVYSLEPAEALEAAASSLLHAWGMAMLTDAPPSGRPENLAAFASTYGLTTEPLRASLAELEALNLPAFVRVGVADKRVWLALLPTDEEGAVRCSTRGGETVTVPREDFEKVYRYEAVVLWRDPAPGAPILRPAMEGDQVRALQQRLRELGFYDGEPTGVYDVATTDAVFAIQTEAALKRDGIAGRQVRMALTSWLDDFPTPALREDSMLAARGTEAADVFDTVDAAPAREEAALLSPTSGTTLPAVAQSGPPGPIAEQEPPRVTQSPPYDVADGPPEDDATESGEADTPMETATDVPPLGNVVELPNNVVSPPSPPARDVEALLEQEIYGAPTREMREEVTPPLYPGAPLVPHRGNRTTPRTGDDE